MGAEIKIALDKKKGKIIPKIVNNPISFPSKTLAIHKIHTKPKVNLKMCLELNWENHLTNGK